MAENIDRLFSKEDALRKLAFASILMYKLDTIKKQIRMLNITNIIDCCGGNACGEMRNE